MSTWLTREIQLSDMTVRAAEGNLRASRRALLWAKTDEEKHWAEENIRYFTRRIEEEKRKRDLALEQA